jgi:EpsI family protein
LIGAAGCLAVLGVLFRANLLHFVYTWSTDENYSHGFLVPLISLYFANEAARLGPVPVRGGARTGVVLLVGCLFGRLATTVVPIGIIGDGAFLLGLAGLCSLLAGRAALRRYGFALSFLAFMVPLPIALYAWIAGPLQLMVSQVASALLNGLGVPVLCQGNLMTLPGGLRMFVAEACSGMRQLTGFLALTTAVAFLNPRPWWYRGLLIGASVPVAMLANVVRVAATGLIMFHVDPQYASGAFHMVEGLLMMGLGLALLAALCGVLNWAWPTARQATITAAGTSPAKGRSVSLSRRVTLAAVVLVTGALAQAATERSVATPRPPLARPLATVPMKLGPWAGHDTPVDPRVLEESQADDHLSRVYEDTRRPGRSVTLWINYSRTGLNLRHSPEVCLPAGGWEKQESQTRVLEVPRSGTAPVPVTRLVYRQGELAQGIGFWYYIFGEGRLERAVRSLPVTSRSSHGRTTRGSGLTVEVFCPGADDPDGLALRDFAAALLDELEPLLPEERANYFRP